MPSPPRVKDRLLTLLCVLAAVGVAVLGLSRGNTKVAIFGALFFLGYAVLNSVTRRLTPAARLVSGDEADARERLAQFRATRLAGQAALGMAAVALVLELTTGWSHGVWVAGSTLLVVVAFVAGLWFYSRRA